MGGELRKTLEGTQDKMLQCKFIDNESFSITHTHARMRVRIRFGW